MVPPDLQRIIIIMGLMAWNDGIKGSQPDDSVAPCSSDPYRVQWRIGYESVIVSKVGALYQFL